MREFTRFDQAVNVPERRAEVRAPAAVQRHGPQPIGQLRQRRQACILLHLAVAFDHVQIKALEEQVFTAQQPRKLPQKSSAQ